MQVFDLFHKCACIWLNDVNFARVYGFEFVDARTPLEIMVNEV